jgi:glutamine synthetase
MSDEAFRGEVSLDAWLDRHHVDIIRTQGTNLDGLAVGKYIHRSKFVRTLPLGHGIADIALAMNPAGAPHMTFWHEFRQGVFGDICLMPDLTTLVPDGNDPNVGHCIGDFVLPDGREIPMCPRTTLKRMVERLAGLGFAARMTFELEFYLFEESFAQAREKRYQDLTPTGATRNNMVYSLRNAYHVKDFMAEVTRRLDFLGIAWEGWNDEAGVGQVELNLSPTSPVTMADHVMLAKQVIYEVAVDQQKSATFMPVPGTLLGSGMHIHHSLTRDGQSVFGRDPDSRAPNDLLGQWLGGLMATLPGAVSYLCPGINGYRRLTDFAGPPTTPTWGEENKSVALRLVTRTPAASRIEHRIGSADLNPYLALAVILAGGICGLEDELAAPAEFTDLAWGLPGRFERLPTSITTAAKRLREDDALGRILGKDVVQYWIKTRREEWLNFHSQSDEPDRRGVSQWEYRRYFEMI